MESDKMRKNRGIGINWSENIGNRNRKEWEMK